MNANESFAAASHVAGCHNFASCKARASRCAPVCTCACPRVRTGVCRPGLALAQCLRALVVGRCGHTFATSCAPSTVSDSAPAVAVHTKMEDCGASERMVHKKSYVKEVARSQSLRSTNRVTKLPVSFNTLPRPAHPPRSEAGAAPGCPTLLAGIQQMESWQHPEVFPGGPPPQYQPGPAPLNFGVRRKSGAFDAVWPPVHVSGVLPI